MYYPILKAKRHELSALSSLSSTLPAGKFRPVIEPVNSGLGPLIKTIESLHRNSVIPLVVINPSQGFYARNPSGGIYGALQSDVRSANKFLSCIKVRDSFDTVSLALLSSHPAAAVYLENDISMASLGLLAASPCVLLNQQKNDSGIISKIKSVVLYADSFAKKKRNADYGAGSFYSNLHVSYKGFTNVVGFGDFTIMGEEYSESGGPAYVVAIHVSHIDKSAPQSMHVRHFCSVSGGAVPTNPGGKYIEALDELFLFDAVNPGFFDPTLGMSEFRALHASRHFPGLGLVKEMSMKHHIESICNYI
jgi:hypothetical protein